MNWTAVGSIAAVASVLIAWLTYQAQIHPTTSPSAVVTTAPASTYAYHPVAPPTSSRPSPVTVPNPCSIPTTAVVAQFALQQGAEQAFNSWTTTCSWISKDPPGWQELSIVSMTFYADGETGLSGSDWVSVAVSGVSGATEQKDQGLGSCDVQWPTSFGFIVVDAAGPSLHPSSAEDSCALAAGFAEALIPDLPT